MSEVPKKSRSARATSSSAAQPSSFTVLSQTEHKPLISSIRRTPGSKTFPTTSLPPTSASRTRNQHHGSQPFIRPQQYRGSGVTRCRPLCQRESSKRRSDFRTSQSQGYQHCHMKTMRATSTSWYKVPMAVAMKVRTWPPGLDSHDV